MIWLLNDISLRGHFRDQEDFEAFFSECLTLKNKLPANAFLISTDIIQTSHVLPNKSFRDAINVVRRDLKQQILKWVDQAGPFWNTPATDNPDNYFEFEGEDVTAYALGESARKHIVGENHYCVYSTNAARFTREELVVEHGIPEDRKGCYEIPNDHSSERVRQKIQSHRAEPTNWEGALAYFREDFSECLLFSPELLSFVKRIPFSIAVYNGLVERFSVLQRYIYAKPIGEESEASRKIIEDYFHGENAWFSDESDGDKQKFANALKFTNMHTNEKETFTYHGKINSNPKIRFYFDWPIKPEQTQIQIVYLGQKITKK